MALIAGEFTRGRLYRRYPNRMFRFLFGAFLGMGLGFAGGFVAGLWLMIRADRDVEEMMREPLPTTESSATTPTASEPSGAAASAT